MQPLAVGTILLVSTILRAGPLDAQLWPNARYDAAIPTFEQVLGHGPGERIVSHAELLDYVDALAAAAPDRMRVW
ncbi:MAG TPA: hypothetical protein VMT85_12790, partial [Thermoanaerobaculia bacterium]|nr:hypothetical protein [Thermoanaerobaculia bacterium]